MKPRPIIWGMIFSVVGAMGWAVSVVVAVASLGKLKFFANFFGIAMLASIPISILWEIGLMIKNRKR